MDRRSFMAGLFAAPIVAALPSVKVAAVATGTVTGRVPSAAPALQSLTLSQVKAMMFAHAYGAPAPMIGKHINCRSALKESDLSAIEARVVLNIEAGLDPYCLSVPT